MRWLSFLAVLMAMIAACKANEGTVSCPAAARSIVPIDELPSGSCSGAGSCGYGVYPCGGPYEGTGRVDGYTCTCASGTWDCKVTSPGASYCGDGGVGASDASAEDAGNGGCVHNPVASEASPATATDTLPVGSCAPAHASCDLVVRTFCCSESDSSRTYYHCECTAGAWQCAETDVDARVCFDAGSSDCPDAGAD